MMSEKIVILADIADSYKNLPPECIQEWENRESVEILRDTIISIGYESFILEPKKEKNRLSELLNLIQSENAHSRYIFFNLIEGYYSRNREGYVPALAEFFGIAFTGSDSYAQNVSLDKELTRSIAHSISLPGKKYKLLQKKDPITIDGMNFPIFLKPNREGSSIGISEKNLVNDLLSLRERAGELHRQFDEILAEEFLEGDDYTVGILGNYPDYEITPVAKIEFPGDSKTYSESIKIKESMPEKLIFHTLDSHTERKIQEYSRDLCLKVKTNGYARIDWKADNSGNLFFLELNLTPGFSSKYSTLPICCGELGYSYSELIKKVLIFAKRYYNESNSFRYANGT